MKIMFRLFWFVIFSFIGTLNYSYNNSCGAYSDEFGPLQTGYTMGDLVRYTVTPNLNQYSTLIAPPAGAQDIAKFDSANRRNLYNALGYLYAGWALVNYRLQVPYSTANTGHLQHSLVHPNFQTKWLKNYRHAGGGSLDELDNNVQGLRAILFPPNPGQSYGGPSVWAYVPQPGENSANFQDVMQAGNEPNANHGNAISSCGWCSNTNNSDYMLVTGTSTVPSPFVMPTGQFFGARIAHILGVVVNDVPWTDDETITNAGFAPNPTTTNPTGSAAKPTSYTTTLISGSDGTGTALPMFATMNHGPWGSTQAPKEMIQNSTAHFGSIATFLKNASIPRTNHIAQGYVNTHLTQTLARLAPVCSYGLDQNNLIEINDNNVTAYDNGVIFAIQNNTGDTLTINQISPATGSTPSQIGLLATGTNNYFLNTASLMAPGTSVTGPTKGNAIEIKDSSVANSSVFIQIATQSQLQDIVKSLNSAYATKSKKGQIPTVSYNEINTYSPSTLNPPLYVLITNFNTSELEKSVNANTVSQTDPDFLLYRIQAINIFEFNYQPYFMTLQINKEQIGYGLSGSQLNLGYDGTAILYPSIVSVKTFTWQNILHQQHNEEANALNNFTYMPLLLLPEYILNAGIPGLNIYQRIWTFSFAAAMTEFFFNNPSNCEFGDYMDFYTNNLGLFNTSLYQQTFPSNITGTFMPQQPPARVIIDAAGQLLSGNSIVLNIQPANRLQGLGQLDLTQDQTLLQAESSYLSLMGCDVWDDGSNFHQDIPILNFYTDPTTSNVVPNHPLNPYINFGVTFGTPKKLTTPTVSSAYGLPYSNMMFFSIPTETLKAGVIGTLSQLSSGNYQLIFTDQANNVLAVQKVFIDSTLYDVTSITVDFLHGDNDTNWTSPFKLPISTEQFGLQCQAVGNKNVLQKSSVSFDLITNKTALLHSVRNGNSYELFDPLSYSNDITYVDIPSDQTISQLKLELVFSDGSSSLLEIDKTYPQQFALIAEYLAKHKSVAISNFVNMENSTASFMLYDALTLNLLTNISFSNLVASDGTTAISTNVTLTNLNVIYQSTDNLLLNTITPPTPTSLQIPSAYDPNQPIVLQSAVPSGAPTFTIAQGSQVNQISLTPFPSDNNSEVSVPSKHLEIINAVIANGHNVSVAFNGQRSVDGSKMDMQYIAYDLTNGKILCQNLFGRNISAIKESNSWASTNITTQGQTISQSPATSITFISQYPFVSDAQIAALAATAKQTSLKSLKNLQNKNYTGVASILKKLGFTINEAQASKVNIAQGQVPTSINFNIGTKLGIMFFKNFWPGATEVAPDITSILQKGDWTTGISLMLLGVDANDNIIPDLTSTDAESFYVMIFDTKTGKNLGGVPIPMTDTTTDNAGGGFSPSHPWSNQIAFGWNAQILTASTTYPFVLTVTSADTSVSIKNAVASVAKDVKSLKKTAKSSKASKAKMTKKQETAAIKKLEGIKSLDPDLTSRIAKLEKSIRKGKITNAEVNRQIKLLDKSLTKYLES